MAKSQPLGRGLGALLGEKNRPLTPAPVTVAVPALPPAPGTTVLRLRLDDLVPCPFQPRRTFEEGPLQELAESLRSQGVVQALTVRKKGDKYEIIAGERRWRAARIAGLEELPAVEREATDEEVVELALVENLQRAGLNPIEEAEGYGQLQQKFALTQEQIAEKVGKARATVANALRLLELDPLVKDQLAAGQLTIGHAKVLLGLKEAVLQRKAAERVIKQTLSVRKTEELVNSMQAGERTAARPTGAPQAAGRAESVDPHLRDAQTQLRHKFGTQVQISGGGEKGRIEIEYYSLDDLNRILALLGHQ